MKKERQQISPRTSAPNGASNTRWFGRKKQLRSAWALALCLSVAGWVILFLLPYEPTWMDTDGFLHEPLFWLIPISYFFLFVSILLACVELALKFRNPR